MILFFQNSPSRKNRIPKIFKEEKKEDCEKKRPQKKKKKRGRAIKNKKNGRRVLRALLAPAFLTGLSGTPPTRKIWADGWGHKSYTVALTNKNYVNKIRVVLGVFLILHVFPR